MIEQEQYYKVETIVDKTYQDNESLIGFLDTLKEPSFKILAESNFKKGLILSIASYFEKIILELILEFSNNVSQGNAYLVAFIELNALKRKYHTLFDWDNQKANSFFSKFGQDFKKRAISDVKNDNELNESIKAFLSLGNLRNKLVHANYANHFIEKTTQEIYEEYKKALYFIAYLRGKLVSPKNEYAVEIINKVESEWKSKAKYYKNGYAVFYGRVNVNSRLMLIGANPGGQQTKRNWKKEALNQLDKDMEYIKYCDSNDYQLAKKTCAVFRKNGHLELLKAAVKTNLIFFRSKDLESLQQKKAAEKFCHPIVLQSIKNIRPKILLCEGMGVLDRVKSFFPERDLEPIREYKRNSRKYSSYRYIDGDSPKILIGITHLSGSRPSKEDINQITEYLKKDIDKFI